MTTFLFCYFYTCNLEAFVRTDQVSVNEMDTKPVTQPLSDTDEMRSKASQDKKQLNNPHQDKKEDCDQDMSVDETGNNRFVKHLQ